MQTKLFSGINFERETNYMSVDPMKVTFEWLEPPNEQWHAPFTKKEIRLSESIGELAVEHVGSTAICGLSAKPIIDIAIAVLEIADARKCVLPLEQIGNEFRGEQGIARRHYFGKGDPRTHHLHMVELSSDFWVSDLLFRSTYNCTSDHIRPRECGG